MDYKPMMCLTEFDVESAIKTWREDGYDEGRADGIAEGITAGVQKGKQEKAVEAARNFLIKGINPEIIAECTGLPLVKVQKLAEELVTTEA